MSASPAPTAARVREFLVRIMLVWAAGVACMTAATTRGAGAITITRRDGTAVVGVERVAVLGFIVLFWPITVPAVLATGALR